MKKIIFVSGIQIFPPESGGQMRSANICLSLARLGYEIEVYSFTGRKIDYLKRKKSSEEKIQNNLIEYINRNPLLGVIQFLFYKVGLPPLWLTWFTHLHIPRLLREKIKKGDTLLLDFPFLYPVATDNLIPLIINTHNAEFELYSDKKFIANLVKKIELTSFKKARNVLFCNDQDEKKFTTLLPLLSSKSFILPNGIELDSFIFNQEERLDIRKKHKIDISEKVFLFTGSRYFPNIQAFDFLVKWAHENASFLTEAKIVIMVAGTVSEVVFDSAYLKVVGKVPEMRPYFWAADFGLNPISNGSGTNVKMIEFLAARLPILTTAFGARGLVLVDHKTCFYFDALNFLQILKEAIAIRDSQKKEMCELALLENQKSVDMTYALKSLPIKW